MSATPTRVRRLTRYAAAGAIAIAALIALILLGLATSPGRNLLATIIERVVTANGISITITNLSGWPPFRFGAEKIVIADVDGPFAEIDNLSGGRAAYKREIVNADHGGGSRRALHRCSTGGMLTRPCRCLRPTHQHPNPCARPCGHRVPAAWGMRAVHSFSAARCRGTGCGLC